MKHLRQTIVLIFGLGVVLMASVGCGDTTVTVPPKATDYCSENQSLACKMVINRYQFLANTDQYGYFYGFVPGIAQPTVLYVVKGSVFPVNDMVTPSDYQQTCTGGGKDPCAVVLQKQQPDGTWGTNGAAMFGWTANGTYFEWNGPYAYSSQPLVLQAHTEIGCPTTTSQKVTGC